MMFVGQFGFPITDHKSNSKEIIGENSIFKCLYFEPTTTSNCIANGDLYMLLSDFKNIITNDIKKF